MISTKLKHLLVPASCTKYLNLTRNYEYYGYRTPYVHPNPLNQPKPTAKRFRGKNRDPKYKAERAGKVQKIKLPDFQKEERDRTKALTPDERRKKMKELGVQPFRPWNERPIYMPATGSAFERYVPPEGDGRADFLSKEGAKQSYEFLNKKGKSMLALNKIRKYEEELHLETFCEEAKKIYIELHECLSKFDEIRLHNLATEAIYPMLVDNIKLKTIRWSFHGSLEPEKVVHIRQAPGFSGEDLFAQLTVRFHTQQTLAVYDRFGRLMHGSETVLRDILEYIVFEKNVSNTYGLWRVHEKIIPPWIVQKSNSLLTFKENTTNSIVN